MHFRQVVGLDHLFSSCDFSLDAHLKYRDIQRKADFNFESYMLEGTFHISNFPIIHKYVMIHLGWGRSEALEKENLQTKNLSGYRLGVGTYLGQVLLTGKATYWGDFWEYETEISRQFKKIKATVQFQKIDRFTELNLKVGYSFSYARRRRRSE